MFIYAAIMLIITNFCFGTTLINSSNSNIDFKIFNSNNTSSCIMAITPQQEGNLPANTQVEINQPKSTDNKLCIMVNNTLISEFIWSEECKITYNNSQLNEKLILDSSCLELPPENQ